jgi:hypothetical protein
VADWKDRRNKASLPSEKMEKLHTTCRWHPQTGG